LNLKASSTLSEKSIKISIKSGHSNINIIALAVGGIAGLMPSMVIRRLSQFSGIAIG
jgi:hypothetical protein